MGSCKQCGVRLSKYEIMFYGCFCEKCEAKRFDEIIEELEGRNMKVKFDKETSKWFGKHIGQQITVCKCEKCDLFYKPSLGHKCKIK